MTDAPPPRRLRLAVLRLRLALRQGVAAILRRELDRAPAHAPLSLPAKAAIRVYVWLRPGGDA